MIEILLIICGKTYGAQRWPFVPRKGDKVMIGNGEARTVMSVLWHQDQHARCIVQLALDGEFP